MMRHATEESFNEMRKILKIVNLNNVSKETGISHVTIKKIANEKTKHTEIRFAIIHHLQLYFSSYFK